MIYNKTDYLVFINRNTFCYKPTDVKKPNVCERLGALSLCAKPNNCRNVNRNCGDAIPYSTKFNA